jgi:hypothetical protein
MKLVAYLVDNQGVDIRPAPSMREWMNDTNDRFAYRCLPLNIANAHGWEILCAGSFTASWDGSTKPGGVTVRLETAMDNPPLGHFGYGILTFRIGCLFRTEAGYDLLVQGPVNSAKDGISALSGIIETDWAPYTFTMNWRFTRPDWPVRFEKGEPICHFFPVQRDLLESFEPEMRPITDDPELDHARAAWKVERGRILSDLETRAPEAQTRKWQKYYYRGRLPDSERRAVSDHRIHVRLKPFRLLATGQQPTGSKPNST